ncbi:MAG TPA: ATP-binding protein, partial [Saprospiraceae bacterium]|nr:ATP-binding protein [Saprospiraceae bacterium]
HHQLKTEQDEALRLKELDTFKSQLFTNLTHEFRTPLTVILGMSKQLATGNWQSILGTQEKGRLRHGLELIENNGKNLLQLINQLLDLSKLENKSFKLQQVQSDIIPYLRYLTESFLSLAEDFDLNLRFTSEHESLVMDFDPEQMKQIMTNLISNAIKFTPAGGEVLVQVSTSAARLQIVVKDTGIGIAEKDLPHILDRFYQADSSSTRVAQGTGIGLAHTQELLKVMDGSIIVESDLGKGTVVTIRLPILHNETVTGLNEITTSKPTVSLVRPPKEQATDDQQVFHQSSPDVMLPQLLIIEDNPDVVEYLKSCLESSYEVAVAYDGKTGVEKAMEQIPDFIISDVMMPVMDGFQVCDRLKNDEHTSHIPIILLTAKADAASRLTGLRRGADAYMAKPFSPEELDLQISTLLENRKRMANYFSRALYSENKPLTNGTPVPEEIQIEDAFIKKVKAIIELYYQDEQFALPQLCDEIGMSRSQLFRKMKAIADISPSDLIRTYRLQKAKALLEQGDITVAEVTYQVGFKDPSYFTKMFQEEFGVAPSQAKN